MGRGETLKTMRRKGFQPVELCSLLMLAALLLALPVKAEVTSVEAQLNVPYIVQFGFGAYSVGGLTADTYRIPLAKTFDLGETRDDWRLRLTAYLGYSHVDFETRVIGPKLTASQDYVFVLPQAELLIPLSPHWTLKPYVAFGSGYGFNGKVQLEGYGNGALDDGFDLLYAVGVSTRYEQPFKGLTASLGSRLGWAGEMLADGGAEQSFATFQIGTEIRHPLGISLAGKQIDLAESFIYYHFFPAAKFSIPGEQPLKVSNQYEFGATIAMAKPSSLWIFEDPQVGVSYRFGDGMTGFRLNLGFPF